MTLFRWIRNCRPRPSPATQPSHTHSKCKCGSIDPGHERGPPVSITSACLPLSNLLPFAALPFPLLSRGYSTSAGNCSPAPIPLFVGVQPVCHHYHEQLRTPGAAF